MDLFNSLDAEAITSETFDGVAELDLFAEELPERLNNSATVAGTSCLFSYSTAGTCISSVSSFCTA